MKGSVLIGQSGGPTSVINASLQGIIEEAFKNPFVTNVYGALNGIDGILHHQIIDFKFETKRIYLYLKPPLVPFLARLDSNWKIIN